MEEGLDFTFGDCRINFKQNIRFWIKSLAKNLVIFTRDFGQKIPNWTKV
jgi:hypothetical protein